MYLKCDINTDVFLFISFGVVIFKKKDFHTNWIFFMDNYLDWDVLMDKVSE